MLMAKPAGASSVEADQQVLRIRRIGKRLFGVANCLITFGDAAANSAENERSMPSIETAFCYSIPQPRVPMVVTDTSNRWAIMRILTIDAMRCDKLGVPLSLIVADLDFFKKINDTYGHPAGDAVLVKVASRNRVMQASPD